MTNSDDVRRLECSIEMTRNLAASSGPLVNLSGFSEICTQQEKPRTMPGLKFAGVDQIRSDQIRSDQIRSGQYLAATEGPPWERPCPMLLDQPWPAKTSSSYFS